MNADDICRLSKPTFDVEGAHWTLPAERELCLGSPERKHMSGGSCLAAVIFAVEESINRPLIQISAQFQAAPRFEASAEISVATIKSGKSVVQASALMNIDGSSAATFAATLGRRKDIGSYQWARRLEAPNPESCPRLPFIREDVGDLQTHLDMREIELPSQKADGSFAFWIKSPEQLNEEGAAPFLAIAADFLPEAINGAIGFSAGAASLDNQLRLVSRDLTEWTLCSVRLAAVNDGICHGEMQLFSQRNQLLAIASQSAAVLIM